MKIAVISSYAWIKQANNYGALLQYYALQKYLSERGHDVYWIRFEGKTNIKRFFKDIIRLSLHNNLKCFISSIRCHNSFMEFTKRNLNLSQEKYRTFEDIDQNPPLADIYITGSDQVWGGTSKENYLCFVKDNAKKVAYAASFGKASISDEQLEVVQPWIKDFKAVSVREDTGVEICKQIGVNAIHLLDPTLLLDAIEYPTSKEKINNNYIFGYFLNVNTLDSIRWDHINSFSIKQGLELKISAVQGSEYIFPEKYVVYLSPQEWLTNYRDAKYVVTNTFHGTVFCIIFHKKFVVIPQTGLSSLQNTRLLSLLHMLKLEDRVWKEGVDLSELISHEINWSRTDDIIKELRSKTDFFFQQLGI